MRKYNRLLSFSVALYVILAVLAGTVFLKGETSSGKEYKVEINRIINSLSKEANLDKLDLRGYQYVKKADYMRIGASDQAYEDFFRENDAYQVEIVPAYRDGVVDGFYRFEYISPNDDYRGGLLLLEAAMAIMFLCVMGILLYLKYKLIAPFYRLSTLPGELAKGHLKTEIKEEKSRFFGRFVWGISQLQDTLNVTRKRELELVRQKKQLLLSLSHDIKTPLSTIGLYAKALEKEVYHTEDEKKHAAHQIGEKAVEIEKYVEEIMRASKDDVMDIQVDMGEFYLADLVKKIFSTYREKCALRMIDLEIGPYENLLLCGDMDRLWEVLENLFENAFKYGDGRRIKLEFYEEDYCQLIRVFNTGEPVSDNDFNHIFESFFRGSNSRGKQGNGLGLYICREIMQKMDGEIFAQKEEDGMAFVFVLR